MYIEYNSTEETNGPDLVWFEASGLISVPDVCMRYNDIIHVIQKKRWLTPIDYGVPHYQIMINLTSYNGCWLYRPNE